MFEDQSRGISYSLLVMLVFYILELIDVCLDIVKRLYLQI